MWRRSLLVRANRGQVVPRMEALGMIVDVAHSSHASVAQILAMARRSPSPTGTRQQAA